MRHSIRISREACQGCVNCIRVCPTEAIRIIDGEINIIAELCIDCGECMRSCGRKALGVDEDDWNKIKESSRATVLADPVFFSQFSHYSKPEVLEEVLQQQDMNMLVDEVEDAYDLSAYATARLIARSGMTTPAFPARWRIASGKVRWFSCIRKETTFPPSPQPKQ